MLLHNDKERVSGSWSVFILAAAAGAYRAIRGQDNPTRTHGGLLAQVNSSSTRRDPRGNPRSKLARRRRPMLAALAATYLGVIGPSVASDKGAVPPAAVPATWRQDADLRDVCFVDDEYGWAVGDHGVILQTQNGGEIWRPQVSQTGAQLSTVYFVDRNIGWAAGGRVTPLSHRSKGILLRTHDGGRSWQPVPTSDLPWIQQIHFEDEKKGYAVGMASSAHPSAVWSTRDGGDLWAPLLGGKTGQHWSGAAFDRGTGLLWSADGSRAWVSGDRVFGAGQGIDYRSRAYGTLLSSRSGVWGSLAPSLTGDQGNSWQSLPLHGLFQQMEIRAAASTRSALWFAGAPSSRILRTADLGSTWQAVTAPAHLPIHRLRFRDEQHACAVGARGLVLATKDGGLTWKLQRGGAKRVAVLAVVADETAIPWQLLARTSAAEEYRVHVAVIGAASAQDPLKSEVPQRLEDAAMRIGATAELLTQLPVAHERDLSASKTLALWREFEPEIVNKLSADLTRLIRVYRPDVVLISEMAFPVANQEGPQQLVNRLVADACDDAASEQAFSAQLSDLGLQTWSVPRLLAIRESRAVLPDLQTLVSSTGASVQDLARSAQHLITNEFNPDQRAWSLFDLRAHDRDTGYGWYPLSGLAIAYGSAQRRPRTSATVDLATQRKTLQRQLQTKRILTSTKVVGRGIQRLEHVERLLGQDTRACGEMLFELAQREMEAADFNESNRIFAHLVEHHPDHALADSAFHWLVRYHTSVERQWRRYRERPAVPHAGDIRLATAEEPVADNKDARLSASSSDPATESSVAQPFAADWRSSVRLLQQIKSADATLYHEPTIAIPFAALHRWVDDQKSARTIYRRQSNLPVQSVWHARARTELAMATKESVSQGVMLCQQLATAPYLDGKLDDACWRLPLLELNNRENASRTQLMIGHDDAYLYIAARCPKRRGTTYFPQRLPRPRDAELETMDRLELLFDVNRDYASWWTIEVDHRGWTRDTLLGDESWNPGYFVATHAEAGFWNVELAMPLEELGPARVRKGADWALGVRRVTPGNGVEHWRPTAADAPVHALQGILRLE